MHEKCMCDLNWNSLIDFNCVWFSVVIWFFFVNVNRHIFTKSSVLLNFCTLLRHVTNNQASDCHWVSPAVNGILLALLAPYIGRSFARHSPSICWKTCWKEQRGSGHRLLSISGKHYIHQFIVSILCLGHTLCIFLTVKQRPLLSLCWNCLAQDTISSWAQIFITIARILSSPTSLSSTLLSYLILYFKK